jgi:transcriptional regulator with XRE-family HTH domain
MRSRITPEMAGLPSSPASRRVPGLRREEIARLADVSTDYYTRLEQGRNIHPSRAVLDSVGRALNLDPGEQAHMIALLENCANSRPSNPAQTVRPALHQLLDAIGNVPALILGRRTDVLAGNLLAFLLLADFPAMPAAERNLARWIHLDPAARELFRDWKSVASEAVGGLRADIARHPNDPQANQLVGELAVQSEHFRRWWAGHRVATPSTGTVRLHHPVVGDLELSAENLFLPDDPDQVLRVFSAKPGSPSADALTLLGSYGAGQAPALEPARALENTKASDTPVN